MIIESLCPVFSPAAASGAIEETGIPGGRHVKWESIAEMKKRHVLLILIGFVPLATLVLLFVLVLALTAYDVFWGWLFRHWR